MIIFINSALPAISTTTSAILPKAYESSNESPYEFEIKLSYKMKVSDEILKNYLHQIFPDSTSDKYSYTN